MWLLSWGSVFPWSVQLDQTKVCIGPACMTLFMTLSVTHEVCWTCLTHSGDVDIHIHLLPVLNFLYGGVRLAYVYTCTYMLCKLCWTSVTYSGDVGIHTTYILYSINRAELSATSQTYVLYVRSQTSLQQCQGDVDTLVILYTCWTSYQGDVSKVILHTT